MPGRRREPRYRLSRPFDGSFRFFRAVDIERRDEGEVSALIDTPIPSGEQMRLDVVGSGSRSTVNVHVAESTAVIVDGEVRYRLRLGILG